MSAKPRPRPCASCPYRRDVPSGIWHPSEYAKLERYDAPTYAQPSAAFSCHQADGAICSGWLAHGDHPTELLAVRLGLLTGALDESCAEYATNVPLFASGAEAADHGCAGVLDPAPDAVAAMKKIARVRDARGVPVTGGTSS